MARQDARADDPRCQLEPAAARAQWLLFALVVALPLGLVLVLPEAGRDASLPLSGFAQDHPLLLKASALLVVLLVVGGLFALLWWMMRRHRMVMDQAGLDLVTSFYRRRLAWPDLRLEQARVVSLGEHPELKPALKSNGYAMPGFRSGWFRTRKLSKVFVATAGGDRVLWIPTTQGYDLLLQPRNPQATLQRMQALATMAPSPGRG